MVTVGEAVVGEEVELVKPVAGLHVYEFAPAPFRVVDCPWQIV